MCNTCGCNITSGNRHLLLEMPAPKRTTTVSVLNNLLVKNDQQAEANRARLDRHGILAVNLMSSPGSGKTALLEATIAKLKDRIRIAVVEGDLETENDAQRIRNQGVPAYQITTGTACHLDAHLVEGALGHLALDQIDLLFIENVGNLVCPASFDLGHHLNVTLLSVTEGDDKPAKYPVMFRAADLMLITKSDLLPYLEEFSPTRAEQNLRMLASSAPALTVSSRSGDGMDRWFAWLEAEILAHRRRLSDNQTLRPRVQKEGRMLHQPQTTTRFRPVKAEHHHVD